jgi:LysM repeat protein
MSSKVSRPFGVLALGAVAAFALVGCGEDAAGPRTTLVDIQPSSYVTRPPVTTPPPEAETTLPEDGRSPVEQTYTIQSGDIPITVAQRFGISLEELVNYNNETPGFAAFIVGAEILIPPNALLPGATATAGEATTGGTTGEATAAGTTTTLPPASECTTGTYTITAEDTTRTAVANRFDVTVDQLDAANANTPGYSAFYPGLQIVIPCS